MSKCFPTTFFVDYDDTLLPSTFLLSQKCLTLDCEVPDKVESLLHDLEKDIFPFIYEMMRFGTIIIISNSEEGWVKLSMEKFYPGLAKLFSEAKIEIVSARTKFQHKYPLLNDIVSDQKCGLMWKYEAMAEKIQEIKCEVNHQFLSFGDSQNERDALYKCKSDLQKKCKFYKSVKMVERPSTEQLKTEFELMVKMIQKIVEYETDLDIMTEIKPIKPPTPPPPRKKVEYVDLNFEALEHYMEALDISESILEKRNGILDRLFPGL